MSEHFRQKEKNKIYESNWNIKHDITLFFFFFSFLNWHLLFMAYSFISSYFLSSDPIALKFNKLLLSFSEFYFHPINIFRTMITFFLFHKNKAQTFPRHFCFPQNTVNSWEYRRRGGRGGKNVGVEGWLCLSLNEEV